MVLNFYISIWCEKLTQIDKFLVAETPLKYNPEPYMVDSAERRHPAKYLEPV